MTKLDRAIKVVGSAASLARHLGVKPSVVGNWRLRGRVPAAYCMEIAARTGYVVTASQLRPDVFGTGAGKRGAK